MITLAFYKSEIILRPGIADTQETDGGNRQTAGISMVEVMKKDSGLSE